MKALNTIAVHLLHNGVAACGAGRPLEWGFNDQWASLADWSTITEEPNWTQDHQRCAGCDTAYRAM